jgi:hypothetical protein
VESGPSFLVACALALLAGCASSSGDVRRVDRDRPIERYGFILYPPSQGDWSLAEKPETDRTEILLLEGFDAQAPTGKIVLTTAISARIASTPAEVFSKHFKDQHDALERLSKIGAQPSSGRFKDLASETTWGQFKGQEFVRVTRRVEERDNPIDPSAVLILETRSTWIFHPTRPTTSLCVMFSHRAPAGEAMPPLAELEESFFSRLAFD